MSLQPWAGVYSVNYYTKQKKARAAAAEIKRHEGRAENYLEVYYGNKTLGNIDLPGMTAEEITTKLKAEGKAYKDRKVKATVDGGKYKFSIKELGKFIKKLNKNHVKTVFV